MARQCRTRIRHYHRSHRQSERGNYVEVHVESDLVTFLLGKVGDVVFRTKRPSSSADHHANRTALLVENLASWIGTSRIPIEPEPLSLIPGPASTEAPRARMLFLSPPLVVAITLYLESVLAKGRAPIKNPNVRESFCKINVQVCSCGSTSSN